MRKSKLFPAALFVSLLIFTTTEFASADWRVLPASDQRQALPREMKTESTVKPGDKWPNDSKFRWMISEIEIPAEIEKKPTAGEAIGLRFSCGDGGEIFINDKLQSRFDNDHPALVILTERATAGEKVRVTVQVYGKVQGGDEFGEATLVIIDRKRASETLKLRVDASKSLGKVPAGLIGLSQGGGMSDYDPATAAKLKEGGFKWFRMDNVLTNAVKKGDDGSLVYDWIEFDKRVDFIASIGAEAIFALSYMPQALDAVPDPERHSAPRNYQEWEDLCAAAAKRCVDRGKRVAFWEVWNEANAGWLKPGPEDTGSEEFKKIYEQATGKPASDNEIVRRLEAYLKLYRASAKGVLRGDPDAKIGGPVLASGPFDEGAPGTHGKTFARGLMIWCAKEKLPLNFVSWHEYFQPHEVIAKQADTFREYLDEFPDLKKSVESFMLTEWNEAWWTDRPHDHEIGAAWCANTVTRAFIPKKLDRPCFFYVKQGDMSFRGDWSMLMGGNVPKPTYHMAKIFNSLRGEWIEISGGDDDVSAVAAWDAGSKRLAIVLVNFRDRYSMRRRATVTIEKSTAGLSVGPWRASTVDATHSNVWHDPNRAELAEELMLSKEMGVLDLILEANSITLLETVRK